MLRGSSKQTDANASSGSPKTKPTTMGVLAALAVPALAVANVPNVEKTPALPTDSAGAQTTGTKQEGEEKKDGLLKRASRLFAKSTDKVEPPGAIEALTAGISNLTVHADHGEMNKHHQRKLSSVSIKRESTEGGKEDDDVEQPSSILGDLHYIQVLGPMKGAERNNRSQSTLHPPTDDETKKGRKRRGDKNARIASYHPCEPPPDAEDIRKFRERLERLPGYLQKVVLSYGGNTHGGMLRVLSFIERRYGKGSPLLQVVRKGAGDYTPKDGGKPRKPRQNCGVKSVFCCLCDDGHDYKTIGHAAAHLTETHWSLKPWRCFTCDESFPHSDMRMTDHVKACPGASAQPAVPIPGPSRRGQTSDPAYMYDTGNIGRGIYDGNTSSQTPPDNAYHPTYPGNPIFDGHSHPNHQQRSLYVPQTSISNHVPGSNHADSGINQYPSSSHHMTSRFPNAFAQPPSGPDTTYRQPPTLSLDPSHGQPPPASRTMHYSQTDEDHSHGLFAASPSSYGTASPVTSSSTDSRWYQSYANTDSLAAPPLARTSTSRQRYGSTVDAGQVPASPTADLSHAQELPTAAYTFISSNKVSHHVGATLLPTRGYVPRMNEPWHLRPAVAPGVSHAPVPARVQYRDRSRQPKDESANRMYQQPQPTYDPPRSAIHSLNYTNRPNIPILPTLPTTSHESLDPWAHLHPRPGKLMGQCNC